MANITAGNPSINPRRTFSTIPYPIAASTKIYQGQALGVLTSTGYVQAEGDTANLRYVGIAAISVDNSAGNAGDLTVPVYPNTETVNKFVQFSYTSPPATVLAGLVAFTDDHTVIAASSTTNKSIAGRVVSIDVTGTAGLVTVDTTDKATTGTAT